MCFVSLLAFVIGQELGAVLMILMAEVQVGILWISDLCCVVLPLKLLFQCCWKVVKVAVETACNMDMDRGERKCDSGYMLHLSTHEAPTHALICFTANLYPL